MNCSGLANCFCEGSGTRYFRLCRLHSNITIQLFCCSLKATIYNTSLCIVIHCCVSNKTSFIKGITLCTLRFKFHVLFMGHEILVFFWFFFNHLKIQKPVLPIGLYENRSKTGFGLWAIVCWSSTNEWYSSNCIIMWTLHCTENSRLGRILDLNVKGNVFVVVLQENRTNRT